MEKTTFNLRKYIKKAFYEDCRGYWNKQSRAWANCYKQKSDDGKSPQEAWNGCLEDFQKSNSKSDWLLSYSADKETGKKPYLDAKTPFVQKNKGK